MPVLIAFASAATLAPVLAAAGLRMGLVDRPGELKIHGSPIPVTGGPTVVAAVLLGLGLSTGADAWVAAAACLALGGGFLDDVRPLPPWARLFVQGAAGGMLVAGGLRLEPLGGAGAAGLVLATIGCCNAVNMVDGQDGLAAGLAAIAALGTAAVVAASGSEAALPLAVAGALGGFLVWNRPPARVFLGDGGAYAVGVLLSASAAEASAAGWHGVLAAGACLGVFAYELVSTIARRLASDAPTIRGDRDHSYDRLGERLGSRPASTFVIWGLGIVAALIGRAAFEMAPLPALGIVGAATLTAVLLDVRLLPVSARKGDR